MALPPQAGAKTSSQNQGWQWERAQGHGSCAIHPWPGSQDSPSPGEHGEHSTAQRRAGAWCQEQLLEQTPA